MNQSKLFSINWADFGKGLLIAFLTALIGGVYELLQAGSMVFDWPTLQPILEAALAAGLAYILKNLFTNSAGEIAKSEKSAMKRKIEWSKGLKVLILLFALLPLTVAANSQSLFRGFLKPVDNTFFESGKAIAPQILIRPTVQVTANLLKWDATEKKVVNQSFSRIGMGASMAHYINTDVDPYNDWSVNALLLLPTNEVITYFSLGFTFSALDIYGFSISAGPLYDFVKGKSFVENVGLMTGVQLKF